jgi:hypothetical protein
MSPGFPPSARKRSPELGVSPNPFSSRACFALPDLLGSRATLDVSDVAGRHVRSLPIAETVSWDGTDEVGWPVPAGVYFVRLASRGRLLAEARLVRTR